MLQQAPATPTPAENEQSQNLLSPEEIAQISDICQQRKIKYLHLLKKHTRYHDFLVEFLPEGIDTWAAHYVGLAEALEAQLGGYVGLTSPYMRQQRAPKNQKGEPIIQKVYHNG